MGISIDAAGWAWAIASVCAVASILIICVTCVVIVGMTRDTAGLRDFAHVLWSWRRRRGEDKDTTVEEAES